MKKKVACGNLYQLVDSVRLANPLARFGKVVRTASKQRVGGSNPSGRANGSGHIGFLPGKGGRGIAPEKQEAAFRAGAALFWGFVQNGFGFRIPKAEAILDEAP